MSAGLNGAALAVLALASTLAEKERCISVEPRHLLAALAIEPGNAVATILKSHGYSSNLKYLDQQTSSQDLWRRSPRFSEQANAIVETASDLAVSRGDPEASPHDIALAILHSRDRRVHAALSEQSIDVSSVIRALLIDVAGARINAEMFDDLYKPEMWSQESNRIVRGAHFERSIFRTNYVGTEHILLSLLRDSNNPAAQFLEQFYAIPITIAGVPSAVKAVAGSGGCSTIGPRFTPNAKELLTTSQLLARRLGQSFVGSEHILLAVLANRGSTAARALSKRIHLDRLQKDLETAFGLR